MSFCLILKYFVQKRLGGCQAAEQCASSLQTAAIEGSKPFLISYSTYNFIVLLFAHFLPIRLYKISEARNYGWPDSCSQWWAVVKYTQIFDRKRMGMSGTLILSSTPTAKWLWQLRSNTRSEVPGCPYCSPRLIRGLPGTICRATGRWHVWGFDGRFKANILEHHTKPPV